MLRVGIPERGRDRETKEGERERVNEKIKKKFLV
jgi:hypothetical protein